MPDELSPAQRRTLTAREALAAKFRTSEDKSRYYREIGERGNAGRVVLRAEDAAALIQALTLLDRVAERVKAVPDAG